MSELRGNTNKEPEEYPIDVSNIEYITYKIFHDILIKVIPDFVGLSISNEISSEENYQVELNSVLDNLTSACRDQYDISLELGTELKKLISEGMSLGIEVPSRRENIVRTRQEIFNALFEGRDLRNFNVDEKRFLGKIDYYFKIVVTNEGLIVKIDNLAVRIRNKKYQDSIEKKFERQYRVSVILAVTSIFIGVCGLITTLC